MKRLLTTTIAALLAGSLVALAGNTVFFTGIGDLTFPFSPPTSGGSVPGLIDNMTIGATTPRAATFSSVKNTGVGLLTQGAPAAKTVSATLTSAEVATGIITVNQGGAAVSNQQLPLATAMDTQFVGSVANDSFDFSVTNLSSNAAEIANLTTNTGWTLVGSMAVAPIAASAASSVRFRARKTATGAWTLYRI